MSKILNKEKKRLGEKNSFHISQMKASIDSLILTHKNIATAHHTPPTDFYTQAQVDALLHQDSIPLHYVGVADGASLGFYASHPAVIHPAADNNSRSFWSGCMPANWTSMINPTLKILFTTSGAGDTATFNLDVDASAVTEASTGSNLYNAGVVFTTVAADTYALISVVLTGTIAAGDIVGISMQKTTVDTRPFNIASILWIERS